MTHPSIPPQRHEQRIAAAQATAGESGIAALLLGFGADLRYLTGYAAMESERLTMLVVPAQGEVRLVVPKLESLPARGCAAARAGLVEVLEWAETDDPLALVADLVRSGGPQDGVFRLAVGDRLWATFVLALQALLPDAAFGLASSVMGGLRIRKDDDEVELLRAAAQAADRVISAVSMGSLVGRTEADIAREIRDRLVAEGHDSADFAIVASGEHAASPHHRPGDRVVTAGAPLVLDIGGVLGGYGSDITRTIWVTGGDPSLGPDDVVRRVHDVVREAQEEATAAVRPGVTCERIDAVARGIIDAGGYGDRFIHRLGHGIGLEGHEAPYLVAGDTIPLEPGMAFSVEPGVYLEGRFGVRIEDIVVCGEHGPIVLNEAPRALLVVDGLG